MHRRAGWWLLMLVGTLGAQPRVAGKIYWDYTYDLRDNAQGYNAFNITRAYFTVRGKHRFQEEGTGYAGYRITLDAKDINATGYYEVFVKYAYFEMGGVFPGLTLRVGQVPTLYPNVVEKVWGFRFLRKVFVDQMGYMSTTDRGLTLQYRTPNRILDFALAVVNGEGYHAPEVDRNKDGMARVSVYPWRASEGILQGLGIHLYGQFGKPDDQQVRHRYIGALSFVTPSFRAMGEFVRTEDGPRTRPIRGQGISVHASVDFGTWMDASGSRSFGLLFRYDHLDPDVNRPGDARTDLIAGAFLRPCLIEASHPNVIMALNVVHVSFEDPGQPTDVRIRLNGEIKF